MRSVSCWSQIPTTDLCHQERCHQALLRAQQAREAALALLASPPKAAEGAGVQAGLRAILLATGFQ